MENAAKAGRSETVSPAIVRSKLPALPPTAQTVGGVYSFPSPTTRGAVVEIVESPPTVPRLFDASEREMAGQEEVMRFVANSVPA
jgi:hypothetical protein